MTDETQTLTREVARCADLLARILDATTPARPSTPSPSGTLTGPPAPNDGQANTRPAANALGENAQTPQEAPVPAASRPHAPGSGTCGGRAGNAPQNAAQCAWPTVLGLYWVRGVDGGDRVEGLALMDGAGDLKSVPGVGRSWSICQSYAPDRLDSAVRVTPVPTELIDRLAAEVSKFAWPKDLRFASSPIGGAAAEIVRWLDQHEEARR